MEIIDDDSETAPRGKAVKRKCFKLGYETEQEAETELARIRSISNRKHVPKRSYQCDYCGRWHLTHLDLPSDGSEYDFSVKKIKRVKKRKRIARKDMRDVWYDKEKAADQLNNGQVKLTSSK